MDENQDPIHPDIAHVMNCCGFVLVIIAVIYALVRAHYPTV